MHKRESTEVRELAAALGQAHAAGNRAGRALHDRVGPLLTGAGLRLQLLCLDQPKAKEAVAEVFVALDEAMEQVRKVSQRLAPSPVYRIGIQAALEKLIGERQVEFPGIIRLKYSAAAKLEPELAVLLYDAIASALSDAVSRGSNRVMISVTGSRQLVSARIADNGGKAKKATGTIPRLLAQAAGFVFSQTTRQGTIVLIRHGIPRPPRG